MGSTSRGSANDAAELQARLNAYIMDEDSNLYFGFGHDLVLTARGRVDLTKLPKITESVLDQLASVDLNKVEMKMNKKLKPTGPLSGMDESGLQDSLLSLCYSVDTHTSTGTAVEFMPPREFSDNIGLQ